MLSDKIFIAVALIILVFTFSFREKITEDVRLLMQLGQEEQVENFSLVHFYPLSQEDRKKVFKNQIEKLTALQLRISKTLFSKLFFDFNDFILQLEELVLDDEIESLFGSDVTSFMTANYTKVIADPHFSKESLLKLGTLLDGLFHKQISQNLLFTIQLENSHIVMSLFHSEDDYFTDLPHYEEFTNQVSAEIFFNESVYLYVFDPESENAQIFESKTESNLQHFV